MRTSSIEKFIPAVIATASVITLVFWLTGRAPSSLIDRVPGRDKATATASTQHRPASLEGQLRHFDGIPADLAGAWPRFRGANFDNVSHDDIRLLRIWRQGEPRILWSINVGEGYAGAAVMAGRVYLMDYDRDQQTDVIRCLSLADGKDIWRYSYPVQIKRNHGMSRTVPAITEKYVVTLSPKCHVTCLDAVSGELLWSMDLTSRFGTKVPPWYAGQCPLIDNDRVILAPGGDDALMIAVDFATGKVLWTTPNPRGWQMTHSSIVPMDFENRRMYVYCAGGGVVGVSADAGELLWETDEWKISIATVPSPVLIGQGRVFLSGGYNAGSMMLRIAQQDSKMTAEPVFRLKPDVFGSAQQTPILHNGYLYGVRPDGELVCLNLDGEIIWSSGSAHRFGLGPYLMADGLIFVMNDTGLLTLVEATPTSYQQLAQAQVLNGHDSWGPMAMVAGRLIARDFTRMVCLDVSEVGLAEE